MRPSSGVRSPDAATATSCRADEHEEIFDAVGLGDTDRAAERTVGWAAELCLDRIGRDALYEPGETDD